MTIRDPRQAFVPGQWLGPVALGTREKPTGGTVSTVQSARAGERAAQRYPWMTVIPVTMASLATSPVVRVTRADPGSIGETAFVNNMNRIVHIKEIRFMAMAPPGSVTYTFDLARRFGVSIKHTNYDIVRDFLPLYALATYNNFASTCYDGSLSFALPAKYTAPKGNGFTMIARNTTAPIAGGGVLGISVNGSDERGNPYVLAREASPALTHTTFQFTENTGAGSLKNCLIERINFNVSRNFTTAYDSFLWGLQTEVQFVPPEGPKWHGGNEWFPINGIVDQPVANVVDTQGLPDVICHQNIVSYRPVTPHIVTPRQAISVDLKCYQNASYFAGQNEIFQVPIWVIMLGTQESLTA